MIIVLELLAVIVIIVATVRSALLFRRVRDAEERMNAANRETMLQVSALTRRVYELERELRPPEQPADTTPVEVTPEVRSVPPVPPPEIPPAEPAAARPLAPEPEIAPPGAETGWRGSDWEAVVGGNWLNKIGALVLVIGISLFLGYSLTHMGPGGRIAVGVVVSVSMLAGGVTLETRPGYAVFASSLIGGGWAALYFTVYAMHALPAARIVESAWLGMAALLTVAVGMILHSLHYRSQTVTALAFAIAFVTLKISPLSLFSVFASVPLAGALLFVAERFGWMRVAVMGVVASYGFYALHYDVEALSDVTFAAGQVVLWLYWLMFEAFDILFARRQPGALARTLMPLNAAGLTGVTLLSWPPGDVAQLYPFFAAAAAAYFASTLVRGRLMGRAPGGDVARLLAGGQESAVAIGALMTLTAVFQKFTGLRQDLGLLVEGEFLFLAGVVLGERYLRILAAAVFAPAVVHLVGWGAQSADRLSLFGASVHEWTPLAALAVALFYLNRALASEDGPAYSYAASVLATIVIGAEAGEAWLAVAWLSFAVVLGLARRASGLVEFERQSLALAGLGWIALWTQNVSSGLPGPHLGTDRISLAAGSVLFEVLAFRAAGENRRTTASLAGASLIAALLWKVLPGDWVAAAWAALAPALAAVAQPYAACGLAVAVFARAWAVNLPEAGRVATSLPAIAALYGGYLLFRRPDQTVARALFALLPSALLTLLLFYDVSGRMLTVAIGAEGAGLLVAGFALRERIFRLSGLALFAFCVLKLFLYDLRSLDAPSRILSFVVLGLFLLAVSWIYTRFREQIRRLTRDDYQ